MEQNFFRKMQEEFDEKTYVNNCFEGHNTVELCHDKGSQTCLALCYFCNPSAWC